MLPAGSARRTSVAVIGPSNCPERLSEVLTGAPLSNVHHHMWVPSLNGASRRGQPVDRECTVPDCFADVGKGKRNRGVLVEA